MVASRRLVLAFAALAAAALAVPALTRGEPAPKGASSPAARATPAPEREPAPAPSADAPPRDTPSQLSCSEVLARVDVALAASDEKLSADELAGIVFLGRRAADVSADGDAERCDDAVLSRLSAARTCSRAAEAVASGLMGSPRVPASASADLITRATPSCKLAFVAAAQLGANVDENLAQIVERLATHPPADVPDLEPVAWFALGSFELTARRHGQRDLERRLDALVTRALHGSRAERRTRMIGVAGNGGCAGCIPDLRAATRDVDPDVRRVAVSAWRFHALSEAATTMCDRLLRDEDARVREQAAWALRFAEAPESDRIDCLVTAAATDPAAETRKVAATTLTVYAPRSARARSALRHLTSPSYPAEIQSLARDYLLALGPRPDDELTLE